MKFLSISAAFLLSASLFGASLDPEVRKAQQVQKDWQSTFKNLKATQAMLNEQIDLVIDTQVFLRRTDLDPSLKVSLQVFQEKALKKIIADPRTITAYLVSDLAQTLIDRSRDLSDLDTATRRWVKSRSEIRLEALEAAIKSIGITAIPALTDFQSKVGKYQASLLSGRIQKLVKDIVKQGEKVAEQVDKTVKTKEQEQSNARELFPNMSAEQEPTVKEGDGKNTTVDFTDAPKIHLKDPSPRKFEDLR